MNAALYRIRAAHLAETEPQITAEAVTLTHSLRERYGDNLLAVVFYGSCLSQPQNEASTTDQSAKQLVDLYAIISDYQRAWPKRRLLSWLAKLLPPNVFFLQQEQPNGEVIHCKYAVLTLQDFEAGCRDWFHCYLYGRFAQPIAITYCQSEAHKTRLIKALSQATNTLLHETLPLLTDDFRPRDLWRLALQRSYSTEMRPETQERADKLICIDPSYYETTAGTWLQHGQLATIQTETGTVFVAPAGKLKRLIWRSRWLLRMLWGKTLSLLRLLKALSTFDGAIDYAVYKVEKHTGKPIQISERIRGQRFLFTLVLLVKLLRTSI